MQKSILKSILKSIAKSILETIEESILETIAESILGTIAGCTRIDFSLFPITLERPFFNLPNTDQMAMDHSDEEDYSELVGCFCDFAEDIISRVKAEGDQNCREGMN